MHDEKQKTWDSPLALRYGYEILDHGFTAVPNLFLQSYSDFGLKDQEAALIIHLLTRKRGSQSPTFRLGDLPMTASIESRKRYLGKLRRLGLVFTRRIYFEGVFPARLRHIELDLSNLLYNLLRWLAWTEKGRPGAFQVTLDPHVSARIREDEYHFVSSKWKKEAQQRSAPVPGQNDAVQENSSPAPAVPGQNDVVQGAVPGKFDPSLEEYPTGDTLELFESQSGPPRGGPAARIPPISSAEGSGQPLPETVETEAESLGEPDASLSAQAASSHRVPSGRVSDKQASPRGLLAEPLPLRRRRVLDDLSRAEGKTRRQVAILTQNLGALLGFEGGLRTAPERADYARIGALAKRYGAKEVWLLACRVAGLGIEGDAIAYLQRCLEQEASQGLKAATAEPEPVNSTRSPPAEPPAPAEGAKRPQERKALRPQGEGKRGLGHLVEGAGRSPPPGQKQRSSYIAHLIVDISQQFGDTEHYRENDAQAHNLWWASGLEEEAFVQRMYRARQRTLQLAGARNRMAYFFTVLRNLVLPEGETANGGSAEQEGTTR